MGEKMKQFLQNQSNREADEILEQINADPEMADVHAPEEMEAALFARIDAYENEKIHSNLSEEDRELIELGKAFKKQKKRRKFTAVASLVLVGVMISGLTAMGGPERAIDVVKEMILGRDRTYVDSQNERLEEVEMVSEEAAYEQIEKEFGVDPVKMHYLPRGIVFRECLIEKEMQYVNMSYQGTDNKYIIYEIIFNYSTSSLGGDVEDILLEEYMVEANGINILMKHYEVKENKEERWILEFKEDNIYYFIQLYNLDMIEVNKIIESIYIQN